MLWSGAWYRHRCHRVSTSMSSGILSYLQTCQNKGRKPYLSHPARWQPESRVGHIRSTSLLVDPLLDHHRRPTVNSDRSTTIHRYVDVVAVTLAPSMPIAPRALWLTSPPSRSPEQTGTKRTARCLIMSWKESCLDARVMRESKWRHRAYISVPF